MSATTRRHASETECTTVRQRVHICPILQRASRRLFTTGVIVASGIALAATIGCREKDEPRKTGEAEVEGKLRFFMVFGGVSEKGVEFGPPTFFIEWETGTYLLTIDPDCELVNVDKLQQLPGFDHLIQGTNEAGPPGSGPVMEVPGTVRARGTVLSTERTISGKHVKELRARYFEHIERAEAGKVKP